ncbi:hypothetical protein [Mycobacterium sp. 3519A]|jgi:hypothetical protein|uniref:hypothetical protein n=1 Tax=Mycobacterium sp. 3519A TaxID=2057184 RepID=UPI001F4078B2|nr:hypothetical protein [Mycobacterium sp. 3519A]
MSIDQIAPDTPVWGAPQTTRGWGWRESAAAVAVAAVIAALGGAAIYAATAGSPHSFGPPHQAFGPGGPPGQHSSIGGPHEMEPQSLHGEFVEPAGPGSYVTVVTQTGTVTAISPTSISVRSEDGYSQTYVIPSTAGNAGAPFAVNDQVVIRATRDGGTLTVTNIGNPQGVVGGPTHHS